MICYHCGQNFTDPFIEALHTALPADVPMTRHGEEGVLLSNKDKPELCQSCWSSLPTASLGKILQEMVELTLRRHYGGLS